ncbi:F-box/LRR-repeat protein 13 [Abeliophyllum distichum]|uniref:F-box/LRR-repeat protein 13 n=1 Tax=Abeliophyllum distichum TaxID=126358 RepID=A0ABD1RUC7_9LAMI
MKKARLIRKIPGDDEDRLSTLPNCVLCYILSFLDTKYVVQTCVLSKRFKNLWSSLPYLNFDSTSFNKLFSFNKFVDRMLTLRDNSVRVDDFKFNRTGKISSKFLDKVMNYAMSHCVLRFNIHVEYNGFDHFPESSYSSESLKSFELKIHGELTKLPSFPELKVLHLASVRLAHSDLVLSCPCLMDLALIDCAAPKLDILNIDAPQLVKLTISAGCFLSVCKVVVSAPGLASFWYSGSHSLLLSILGELSSLEVVSIDVDRHHL